MEKGFGMENSFIFNVEIDEKRVDVCLREQDRSAKELIASDMFGKKKTLSFGNIYNYLLILS